MNVPMAFYLFSEPVYTAMELYSDQHCDLQDCESTIKFSKRISHLIKAMMSRTPQDALRENSNEYEVISGFLGYLVEWENGAKLNKLKPFLSQSTCNGLKVTLKATLELFAFLKDKHNVQYLMTSRLNQDALVRFFGLVRQACGSNDHRDSRMFAQIFRLLSMYSLIKPKKGSNVEGVDILEALINLNDRTVDEKHTILRVCDTLDKVILNDEPAVDQIPTFLQRVRDHDERLCMSPEFVQGYMAGYVAFRGRKLTTCDSCLKSIENKDKCSNDIRFKMIDACNCGRLKYPSDDLYTLTNNIENIILKILAGGPLNRDTFTHILESLDECEFPRIGCSEHAKEFTKKVSSFYLITRGHFIAKRCNTVNDNYRTKSKKNRKDSKL